MRIKWKAENKPGTHAYYVESYSVQHFTDWFKGMFWGRESIWAALWFLFRQITSKKAREDSAREYNRMMFGNIPTNQIYVMEKEGARPLREEERTWPE